MYEEFELKEMTMLTQEMLKSLTHAEVHIQLDESITFDLEKFKRPGHGQGQTHWSHLRLGVQSMFAFRFVAIWLLLVERERERLSLSAFLRTEDIGVHIVHISRLIITYTLE